MTEEMSKMECLQDIFPIILYILLIILVIFLIILVHKAIKTLGKVDKVVEDVNQKMNKVDGVFNIIDSAADTMNYLGDRFVSFLSTGITSLFKRKKKGENIDE